MAWLLLLWGRHRVCHASKEFCVRGAQRREHGRAVGRNRVPFLDVRALRAQCLHLCGVDRAPALRRCVPPAAGARPRRRCGRLAAHGPDTAAGGCHCQLPGAVRERCHHR
eukprot:1227238-Rhodomonas_salina.1